MIIDQELGDLLKHMLNSNRKKRTTLDQVYEGSKTLQNYSDCFFFEDCCNPHKPPAASEEDQPKIPPKKLSKTPEHESEDIVDPTPSIIPQPPQETPAPGPTPNAEEHQAIMNDMLPTDWTTSGKWASTGYRWHKFLALRAHRR